MSDFFGGIYGHRMPDSIINGGGPLPPSGGLPAPLHDTADGKINYNSTLLGDLTPYSYGQSQYISSDTSFINIPHLIPKVIPELFIPCANPDSNQTVPLSHSVSDSDIAFVLKLDRNSDFCTILSKPMFDRQRTLLTVDPFINLVTINYLLAGLQVCMTPNHTSPSTWFRLLHDLDRKKWGNQETCELNFEGLVHIVKNLIAPFGIVRGSDKQGGQSQYGYGPSTWPACFIATMNIDGIDENVVNLWTKHELPGGSRVVLRLKPCKLPKTYTLTHNKGMVRQQIQMNTLNQDHGTNFVWQLVPDVFDLEFHPYAQDLTPFAKLPKGFELEDMRCSTHPSLRGKSNQDLEDGHTKKHMNWLRSVRSWQDTGYWHIGLTHLKMGGLAADQDYYFDDMHLGMRQPHLKMTFEPQWMKTAAPFFLKPKQMQKYRKWFMACDPPEESDEDEDDEDDLLPDVQKAMEEVVSKVNQDLQRAGIPTRLDVKTLTTIMKKDIAAYNAGRGAAERFSVNTAVQQIIANNFDGVGGVLRDGVKKFAENLMGRVAGEGDDDDLSADGLAGRQFAEYTPPVMHGVLGDLMDLGGGGGVGDLGGSGFDTAMDIAPEIGIAPGISLETGMGVSPAQGGEPAPADGGGPRKKSKKVTLT